jgi:hypothetical protein
MAEDIIEKVCCNCGRTFNWEWTGCFLEDKFFCDNDCAKEKYPESTNQAGKRVSLGRLLNGRTD